VFFDHFFDHFLGLFRKNPVLCPSTPKRVIFGIPKVAYRKRKSPKNVFLALPKSSKTAKSDADLDEEKAIGRKNDIEKQSSGFRKKSPHIEKHQKMCFTPKLRPSQKCQKHEFHHF